MTDRDVKIGENVVCIDQIARCYWLDDGVKVVLVLKSGQEIVCEAAQCIYQGSQLMSRTIY